MRGLGKERRARIKKETCKWRKLARLWIRSGISRFCCAERILRWAAGHSPAAVRLAGALAGLDKLDADWFSGFFENLKHNSPLNSSK